MKLPSRRRLGAAALIVAGIGAFLVPFLLHSPSSQGTSPTTTSGNNNNNNNNGGQSGGTTTTTTTSGNGNGGSNGGNGNGGGSENCAGDTSNSHKSHDPSPRGNAWGVVKNKLDTTVATVKAMGAHDPAFHLHHDTDTDNGATNGEHGHSHNSGDPDSSCAAGEEEHDKD